MKARFVIETRRWELMARESNFSNVNDLFAIGISAGSAYLEVPQVTEWKGSQVFTLVGARAAGSQDSQAQVHVGIVDLDEERKAAMVSNLLVVLCGDSRATPVVNTGTLYQ